MTWENTLYIHANECMAMSWRHWAANEIGKSWGYTVPARLSYLADTVSNACILPFAIIAVTFGSIHALFTWNLQSVHYQTTKTYIMERSNHLFLSLCGSVVSPAIAHKYRDANIAPFIIAARITVISCGLLYALLKR